MRLWHERLVPFLPRQQLLGQHRECCALRGKGWGRRHSTVDYVFTYSPARLYMFHRIVMEEMLARGYNPAQEWFDCNYRGKNCEYYGNWIKKDYDYLQKDLDENIYPEHNEQYLQECLDNLMNKGITCRYFS